MSEATTQVTVHFTGAGAGDEELSWGQQEIYRAMVRQGTWLPIGGISTPSPGATVDDIADELRYLMSRYESMRTRLRFTADGRPRQVVHADGEITLEVVDTDDDPALVAAAVQRRYEHTDLDLEKQWPVRMAVIRRRGILTHQVSVFSHLVTDQAGGAVMLAEVRARNSAPVAGPGPLAQARWQQGAAGQRRSRAALRHYESLLRALTPLPADASTDRRTPRYQQAEFVSPATLLAVRAIAARLPADPATVLLTLVAIALTDTTGATAPLPLRPIVSNRFQPGLATAVANINQAGLCLLDVAGVDFEVAVERTRRASLAAFKHAYHDPAAVAELIDRVSGERGTDVDVRCFYNDRRTRPLTGPAPTLDDITTALHRTTCAWSAEP
ncbi:MAG TPA: condensation domain-containing protein, partial [Actinoplanes sp.]|nr:condensation domain-containing protein [Actinoplanes sp.]